MQRPGSEGPEASYAAGESQVETPRRRHYVNYLENNYYIWTFGRGEDGQLGLGDTSDVDEPVLVESLKGVGVTAVACGSGHTVALTQDGEVYSFGRGDDGRLGHGDCGWKYVPRLVKALAGIKIVRIACGSYHTAGITSNGELYTWGGSLYGKLGHGNERGESTPKRVESLAGQVVGNVACGSRHTLITTHTGVIYSWGDNENGVSGHGHAEGHQYLPRAIERLAGKQVIQISACGFHSAAITVNNEIYSWGEGKFGRLGHGNERNCYSPTLIEFFRNRTPNQVSCGGFHSAVVTTDGSVYCFGGGEHGQLMTAEKCNKTRPTLVPALDGIFVTEIACGWSHTVVLTDKGHVYTSGNSDHGKLGLGSSLPVALPRKIDKLKNCRVIHVASYNEHTAILAEPLSNVHTIGDAINTVAVTAHFAESLRRMVNDDEFSDIQFVVQGNESVYAHRAILAQRCDHFAAMFRSGMRESVSGIIQLPNVSKTIFLLLMEYIYTDAVKVQTEHAIELYQTADLYGLEQLTEICRAVVRRNLTPHNAGALLQEADALRCEDLRELIMAFVVENFDQCSKTEGIQQVSHSLLLEILSKR